MNFLKKVLIVVISTFALLMIFEITLRTFFPQDTIITNKNETLGKVDSKLGHINRPGSNTTVRTPEFLAEYRISGEGLRDNNNHQAPKSEGVSRVLLLGDSFTFGVGSQYEEIWPVIFESELSRRGVEAEVIKAGVPAYDTTKEVLLLERLFPIYEPDIVVLVFLANDLFTNTDLSTKSEGANQNSPKEDKTVRKNNEKNSSLNMLTLYKRLLISNDWVYTKLYMMTPRSEYFRQEETDTFNKKMEITKELLLRAAEYTESRGAEFIVLSIPQQFQVLYKANSFNFENTDVDRIDNELSAFAEENGFILITLLEELAENTKAGNSNLYYRLDGHLNTKGNQIVGEYFSNVFIDKITSKKEFNDQ